MDNRGKPELIHAQRGSNTLYLLGNKPTQWLIHNNYTDRMALSRRQTDQISALSTMDGRIEAYHGYYG